MSTRSPFIVGFAVTTAALCVLVARSGAQESAPAANQPASIEPAAAPVEQPQPDSPTTPASDPAKPEPITLDAGKFGALSVRGIGPALMSGRVGDIAVNPKNTSEFYVAVSSGNLWKTVNRGTTFSPIFDGYGSYSIGCVTLDPTNSNVVWVGTGENNSQRSVSFGDGVYVSRDGGKSFKNVGLPESEHIGMIRVDPRNPNTVFVAAMGPLWRSGGDRGLYRTKDGGGTWERVLHVSDDTGISEIHMDPRNPDVMYAVAYQRRRHVWTLINGGPESAIYMSTDAGAQWRKLESGLPGEDKGRIGLAVSPANPDVLYAIVEAAESAGGIFRSVDRGASWEKRSSYMTSSPQYYNELFADPVNVDRFYTMDTFMQVSDDGGATLRAIEIPDVHVDFHALWINPSDTNHMLAGNDGGLYETFDRRTWQHFENLSVTQFYRVATDNSEPFYYVYGGTQDNSTLGGPSRTTDRVGIASEHWFICVGGDGFEPAIDPVDPNTVYAQWQHAGLVRFDRASGEEVDIRPRQREGDAPQVWNWDTPLIVSPHKHTRLYLAGRVLHKSEDRGNSWTVVSPDLTRGIDRNQLEVMGVIQKPEAPSKHLSTSIYGNCVSLSESPRIEGLLYIGTDDGLVHVSGNSGDAWTKIESFTGVPERTYVSDLETGRHADGTVFAAFDNHKNGDFTPYLLRSDDRGATWRSIAGDLPKNNICYSIAEDHENPNLLFVGTEFGCYFTLDGGIKWMKVSGLPTIAVRDVELQRRENDLVLATFGRGFYVLDDYSPLRTASVELFEKPAHVFPARSAWSYQERARLGGGGRGWSGSGFFNAPNPAFGATFTYYIKDKTKTLKESRLEAQKKDGWKYPTLDEFRAEDAEADPRVVLVIRDGAGSIVRTIDATREAGLHRTTWNLRYPGVSPGEADGAFAPPGSYSVQLASIIAGVATPMADAQSFEVKDLDQATFAAKAADRDAKFAFEQQAAALQRAVSGAGAALDEIDTRISALRNVTPRTPSLALDANKELEAFRLRARNLRISLRGDPTYDRRAEPEGETIAGRASFAYYSTTSHTQNPTQTAKEQYEIAAKAFTLWLADLRAFGADVAKLEAAFDGAQAPWTPGRMPTWPPR